MCTRSAVYLFTLLRTGTTALLLCAVVHRLAMPDCDVGVEA